MDLQVPPEVYDLFSNAQKKGEEAEKEWDATMATYKEKYPEVRASLVRLRPPFFGAWCDPLHVKLTSSIG